MLRRWGRRSETYLFGSRRGQRDRHGPLADGTPYDLTFQFELVGYNFEPSEIGAAYALVQLDKLAEYNGRRQHNWNRLHDLMARARGAARAADDRAGDADHLDALPVPAARGRRPRRAAARAHGSRHLHASWCGAATSSATPRTPTSSAACPTTGLPNADAVTERALSLPAHHALSSDDLGYMVEVVGEELAAL